ncbi:hypothetical protein GUJ93_ZPchr0013g34961 [Zizania palustris]|uniref:Uncharacterized protein n=1 Tax=Zizania palustris TaxID=103762 RepID=A0A8J5WZF0_ZIZPA|nr:hypothetical protein GUJ93_ZPchr0013g34961 [Zizania palustris]
MVVERNDVRSEDAAICVRGGFGPGFIPHDTWNNGHAQHKNRSCWELQLRVIRSATATSQDLQAGRSKVGLRFQSMLAMDERRKAGAIKH